MSKSTAWQLSLAEAKQLSGFEQSVVSIEQMLLQQQPCWNRVFELLLQGHPLPSGHAASSSAVSRLPPNVPLMMLAWGKLEAYAVDRRLMGLQTQLPYFACYLGAGPAQLAKSKAMCAHLFDNFALDDLLVALKREGGKWGDVVGGIDPVIHILEAIHRCEHSHASSFTLLQKGETGFDRPELMLEALPFLRETWARLGFDDEHELSVPSIIEETATLMNKYRFHSDTLKKKLFLFGPARMRGCLATFGKRVEIFRSGGVLTGRPPFSALDKTDQHEKNWDFMRASLQDEEKNRATDRAIGLMPRLEMQAKMAAVEKRSAELALQLEEMKKRHKPNPNPNPNPNPTPTGGGGTGGGANGNAPALVVGAYKSDDYYKVFNVNDGSKTVSYCTRYNKDTNTCICATPVAFVQARKEIPKVDGVKLCADHHLFFGMKDKDGNWLGCAGTRDGHTKNKEGAHAAIPAGDKWKRGKYFDTTKRVVQVAALAAIQSGTCVMGQELGATNGVSPMCDALAVTGDLSAQFAVAAYTGGGADLAPSPQASVAPPLNVASVCAPGGTFFPLEAVEPARSPSPPPLPPPSVPSPSPAKRAASLAFKMHPASTADSVYLCCTHGRFALGAGRLNRNIDAGTRCQQVECVKAARALYLANRDVMSKALKVHSPVSLTAQGTRVPSITTSTTSPAPPPVAPPPMAASAPSPPPTPSPPSSLGQSVLSAPQHRLRVGGTGIYVLCTHNAWVPIQHGNFDGQLCCIKSCFDDAVAWYEQHQRLQAQSVEGSKTSSTSLATVNTTGSKRQLQHGFGGASLLDVLVATGAGELDSMALTCSQICASPAAVRLLRALKPDMRFECESGITTIEARVSFGPIGSKRPSPSVGAASANPPPPAPLVINIKRAVSHLGNPFIIGDDKSLRLPASIAFGKLLITLLHDGVGDSTTASQRLVDLAVLHQNDVFGHTNLPALKVWAHAQIDAAAYSYRLLHAFAMLCKEIKARHVHLVSDEACFDGSDKICHGRVLLDIACTKVWLDSKVNTPASMPPTKRPALKLPPAPSPSSSPPSSANVRFASGVEEIISGVDTPSDANDKNAWTAWLRNASMSSPRAIANQQLSFKALGIPDSGSFFLYICSGVRREGDVGYWIEKAGDATMVCIDIEIGGAAHDIDREQVVEALVVAARLPRCLGALLSLECRSWSAAHFRPDLNGKPPNPRRDAYHPLGIPDADGRIPEQVLKANRNAESGARIACAAAMCGKRVIAETPSPRGTGVNGVTPAWPTDALEGAEHHVYLYDYPAWAALIALIDAHVVVSDQCAVGDARELKDATEKSTAWLASPAAHDEVHKLLDGKRCPHGKSAHKALRGPNGKGGYRTQASQSYSKMLCYVLACCLWPEKLMDVVAASTTLPALPTAPLASGSPTLIGVHAGAASSAMEIALLGRICNGAPLLELMPSAMATVIVPVLVLAKSLSNDPFDDMPRRFFALTPVEAGFAFGVCHDAKATSKGHESCIATARRIAGLKGGNGEVEGEPIVSLAGEIELSPTADGSVPKLRVVALSLFVVEDPSNLRSSAFGFSINTADEIDTCVLDSNTRGSAAVWTRAALIQDEYQRLVCGTATHHVLCHCGPAALGDARALTGALGDPKSAAQDQRIYARDGPSCATLLSRSTQLGFTVQRRLLEERGSHEYMAFCTGLADRLGPPKMEGLPEVLRGDLPSFDGLQMRPYERPCIPHRTESSNGAAPPPPPSFDYSKEPVDGVDWRDKRECRDFQVDEHGLPIVDEADFVCIEDCYRPWAIKLILSFFRRCNKWARGECKRPNGIGLGECAIYPKARGRVRYFDENGMRIDTPMHASSFNAKRTRELLSQGVDKDIVDVIADAVPFEHFGGIPLITVLAPPLESFLDTFEGASTTIAQAMAAETVDYIKRGWVQAFPFESSEGFLRIPSCPCKFHPAGGVRKGDKWVPCKNPSMRGIVALGFGYGKLGLTLMPLTLDGKPRPPSTKEASANPIESVNAHSERCYTLEERKCSVSNANHNASVQRSMVDPIGWTLFVFVFDYLKCFHQFVYAASQTWMMNRLAPVDVHNSKALQCVRDKVMIMGEHSSSKICQRAVDTMHAEFMKHLLRVLMEHNQHLLPKALLAQLQLRDRNIPHDECGSHGTPFDIMCFTDDPQGSIMDDPAKGGLTMLFFKELFSFIGPGGINFLFAEWRKWDLGCDAKWLGVMRAPALGVCWLTPQKVNASRDIIRRALEGNSDDARARGLGISVELYRRLHGLLVSLVEGCGLPRSMLFYLAGPLGGSNEISRGLDTIVEVEMHAQLGQQLIKWDNILMEFPGASMLCAVKVLPKPRATRRWRARCDAALEGTPYPGLGGAFHNLWWRFALTGVLLDMPIVWHEPIAYGLMLVVFKTHLQKASHVLGLGDATLTKRLAQGEAHAAATQFISDGINELTISKELGKKLEHDHGFGQGNDLGDYPSRGYITSLELIGAQMGLRMQEVKLQQDALEFLAYMYGGLLVLQRKPPSRLPEPLLSVWQRHAHAPPASSAPRGCRNAALLIAMMAAGAGAQSPTYSNTRITPALIGLDVSPACLAHDGATCDDVFDNTPQLASRRPAPGLRPRSCIDVLRGAREQVMDLNTAPIHIRPQLINPSRTNNEYSVGAVAAAPSTSLPAEPAIYSNLPTLASSSAAGIDRLGASAASAVAGSDTLINTSRASHGEGPNQGEFDAFASAPNARLRAQPAIHDNRASLASSGAGDKRWRSWEPDAVIMGGATKINMSSASHVSARRPRTSPEETVIKREDDAECNDARLASRASLDCTLDDAPSLTDFEQQAWEQKSATALHSSQTSSRASLKECTIAHRWALSRQQEEQPTCRELSQAPASGSSGDGVVAVTHPPIKTRTVEQLRFRAESMCSRMRNDSSRYALNVDDDTLEDMAWYAVGESLDEDEAADALKGFNSAAWKYWVRYCNSVNTTPWRDDHAANTGINTDGYEREVCLWTNALPAILGMMSSRVGWSTPPRPTSALKNLRTVRALMIKSGATPPPLHVAASNCVRMMKTYLSDNGVESVLPHQKEPFLNSQIQDMCECEGPVRGSKKSPIPWDWCSHEGIMFKCYIHTAAQTGMRNEEFTSPEARGFSKRDLSLANLSWFFKGERRSSLEEWELDQLSDGDYAILTPSASKCDPFGMKWGTKPIWLPFSAMDWLCAARCLRDVERLRLHLAPSQRCEVPLFAHECGKPWSRSYTFNLLRLFVTCIGTPADRIKDYTPHSFRIYLCNALANEGLSDGEIQAALRWASPDSINTYRLTSKETFARWLSAAMGTRFTVVRGGTLRRANGAPMPRHTADDAAISFVQRSLEMLELAHETKDD